MATEKTLYLNIPATLHEKISAAAESGKRSISNQVQLILERYFKSKEKNK